ncbi:hypothetical protein OS493_018012 [Desmophyllum pertusum]|uniref:Uncharacterized protein n=1 Tax=Desmophyllum pertusum TaxID=174260 RepID=A0A9W9Z062_9CNID|nr:hypothetical protein OS493_018012 [Desmophyllum pertusum]
MANSLTRADLLEMLSPPSSEEVQDGGVQTLFDRTEEFKFEDAFVQDVSRDGSEYGKKKQRMCYSPVPKHKKEEVQPVVGVQTLFHNEEFKFEDAFVQNVNRDGSESEHTPVPKFWKKRSSKKTKVTPMLKSEEHEVHDKGVVITRVFDRNRFSHSNKPLGSYLNVPLPPGFLPSEIMIPAGSLQDDATLSSQVKHRNIRHGPKSFEQSACVTQHFHQAMRELQSSSENVLPPRKK